MRCIMYVISHVKGAAGSAAAGSSRPGHRPSLSASFWCHEDISAQNCVFWSEHDALLSQNECLIFFSTERSIRLESCCVMTRQIYTHRSPSKPPVRKRSTRNPNKTLAIYNLLANKIGCLSCSGTVSPNCCPTVDLKGEVFRADLPSWIEDPHAPPLKSPANADSPCNNKTVMAVPTRAGFCWNINHPGFADILI